MRAHLARFPGVLGGSDEARIVELDLVGHDVGVGVRGRRDVALADGLADRHPRNAGQVEQRDPAVTEIMRTEDRDAGTPPLGDMFPPPVGG